MLPKFRNNKQVKLLVFAETVMSLLEQDLRALTRIITAIL